MPPATNSGIQPVAAFLEVTAIGHLRDDVGRSQQRADQPVHRIVELDRLHAPLVPGEVQDLARDFGEIGEADRRQVLLEETPAARHVRRRVLRALAMPGVLELADVAAIVEQRADHAQLEMALVDVRPVAARALVAVEQARHGERHVEHVLDVVVFGVAARVAGIFAAVHAHEVVEGVGERGRLVTRVERAENARDFELHADRIGGVDPVGDVELASTKIQCALHP